MVVASSRHLWKRSTQAGPAGATEARYSATALVSAVAKTATYTHAYAESNGFLTLLSDGECLTAEEAIRAYCLGSAYAGHADHVVGSLEPGKYADFVVLSADPTTLDAAGIARLETQQVFVNGELAGE